jgi:hypothetical protein
MAREPTVNRRTVLATIGTVAGGKVVGTGLVAAREPQTGAADVGIASTVQQHLMNNEIDAAHRLLDKHNVWYVEQSSGRTSDETFSGTAAASNGDKDCDKGAYDICNSWVSNNLIHDSGDKYLATLNFKIGENTYEYWDGGPGNVDPLQMSWSDNYWEPVEMSRDNYYGSNRISYEDYQVNGILADHDDPQPHNEGDYEEHSGSLQTYLYRLDYDHDYLVGGEYVHTYTKSTKHGGFSFNLPPRGIVSIDLEDYSKGEWRLDTSTRPSD